MKNVVQNIASIWNRYIHRALAASRQRLFALMLAVIVSIGAIFAESGKCGDNLTWTLDDDVLIISGTGAMEDYKCHYLLNSDKKDSPWDRTYISTLIIKNGVTRIGDGAFESTYITTVTIPNSVTSIGNGAFCNCERLTAVTIPNSVTNIGNLAFHGCAALTSVTIPNSVKSIGYMAFDGCKGLRSIKIPNSVESIGDWAFSGCKDLTSIMIPNSVKSIGDCVFSGCESLTSIAISNSVESIGDWAFSGCKDLTSIMIPNSVKSIGDHAFSGCKNLTSVTIGNNVKSIGDQAFRGCSSLTSVTLPNSVDTANLVFYECKALTSPIYNDHLFVYMPRRYWGAYAIPNGIETIAPGAFGGCGGLTSITIPNSVTNIGYWAFSDCISLTSITIPNSVKNIGEEAFSHCAGLTSPIYNDHVFAFMPENYSGAFSVPDGIESIAGGAFRDCRKMTSVTIPNNVTNVGDRAFYGCNLESPIYNAHVFAYMPKYYSGAYAIPDGIESIAGGAFEDCSSLTSVTIPNSITSIGYMAFDDCTSLTSVIIPNSVKSIGGSAFSKCKSLTSITIPNSVESIGYNAFYRCEKLTSVTIGNSFKSIGYDAFQYCDLLASVTCYSITPEKIIVKPGYYYQLFSAKLFVPIGYRDAYRNTLFGQQFGRIEEIYVEPSILLSKELDAANAQMAQLRQQYNEAIAHSPYTQYLSESERDRFFGAYSPAQIPDSYNFNQAKAFCDSLQRVADAMSHQDPVAIVKDYLRTTRPDDFVSAYFQEYPAEKEHLGGEYKEYRCHYPTLTDFVIQYEQGRLQLSERNCRETRWAECADYYASREQFDIDYNQGDDFINNYRSRIDNTWSAIQNLPEKVLKKNLQGASEESKEEIVNIASLYHQLDPSPTYQNRAADFLLSNNKKMGKEYEKNGAYFSLKTDFIAAYFSKDYKQILKSKK